MDIATIGLRVDSTGVVSAADDLDDLTAASGRAEKAAKELGDQSAQSAPKIRQSSAATREAKAAQDEAAAATTRAAATQQMIRRALQATDEARYGLLEGLREEVATFGMSAREMTQYQARLLGVSAAADPLIAKLGQLESAQRESAAAAAREVVTQQMVARSLEATDTARYELIEGLREQVATFGMSARQLAQYQASLLGVSGSVDPLIAKLDQLEHAQKQANAAMQDASTRSAFLTSLRDQSATYGKTTSEVLEYRAAQLGVSKESSVFIQRIRDQENAVKKQGTAMRGAGLSAGEYKNAMRQVPAQITDIVTSLISGQPAYLVAIQQGGQLKDSFGGIGPAARALVSAISPMTLILTAVAAAAGTVAIGFAKGRAESDALTRSLIMTGNYAGVTAGQLGQMAESIDGIVGTRAKASEVLGMLVSTGKVGGDSLQYFARSAIEAERALGVSTETIVKNFADLGKEPVSASLKLNEAMHYLNAATIEQIQALDKAGKQTDAAKVAQDAYADALKSRSGEMEENIGTIERAWRGVKGAIKEAGDAVLNIGRVPSDDIRLAQLVAQRGSRPLGATSLGDRGDGPGRAAAFAAADREERALRERVTFLKQGAENQAEFNRRVQEGTTAQQANLKTSEQFLTNQQKLNKAIKEYRDNEEKKRLGGFKVDSPEQQARVIAGLTAQFKTSTLDSDLAAIQRNLNQVVATYENASSALDAQRSAQLISDEEYFSKKSDLIRKSVDAEVAALQAENARLAKEKAINEEAIRNQDKIKDNLSKITILRNSAANAQRLLSIQETADQEKLNKAQGRSNIGQIQSDLQARVAAYANSEKQLEAQRSAGLIKDADYYDAKKRYVEQNAAAQQVALQREITLLSQEKAIGVERIALDERIAAAKQKLALSQADAVSAIAVLNTQQIAANKALEVSFAQADAASRDYLATLERGYKRQISDFGSGPAARRYSVGRNEIDDRAMSQRAQLESDNLTGTLGEGVYDARLAAINKFHADAIAQWDDYYARIEERERDFGAGFSDAFKGYADSLKNVGGYLGGELISAFDQAKGAAADLAAANLLWGEGGSEAAKAIARDLLTQTVSAMIQAAAHGAIMYAVQQRGIVTTTAMGVTATQTAASAQVAANAQIAASAAPAAGLTSLASFGANSVPALLGIGLVSAAIGALIGGAFADGGDPPVGKISLVGERGPELFVPKSAGTIIPNEAWSGAGGRSSGGSAGGGMTVVLAAPGLVYEQRGDLLTVSAGMELMAMIEDNAVARVASDITDGNSQISRGMSSRMGPQQGRF